MTAPVFARNKYVLEINSFSKEWSDTLTANHLKQIEEGAVTLTEERPVV